MFHVGLIYSMGLSPLIFCFEMFHLRFCPPRCGPIVKTRLGLTRLFSRLFPPQVGSIGRFYYFLPCVSHVLFMQCTIIPPSSCFMSPPPHGLVLRFSPHVCYPCRISSILSPCLRAMPPHPHDCVLSNLRRRRKSRLERDS